MRGTKSTTGLSRFQQVLVVLLWLGSFLVLAGVLAPRFPNNPAATVVTIAAFLPSALITWALYRFAAQQQTQITTLDGLRGPFTVYDFAWPLLLLPASILVVTGGILLSETAALAHMPLAWALVLIAALVLIGGPLMVISSRVHAFAIDEDAKAWVRRWGYYQPLRVAEFTRVRAYSTRSRFGHSAITRLVFSGGNGLVQRVSLPISYVVSRRYHTLVNGAVISAFFLNQCEQAGFHVQYRGQTADHGWTATRTNSP